MGRQPSVLQASGAVEPLTRLIEVTRVLSPTSFVLGGFSRTVDPPHAASPITVNADDLLQRLQQELYGNWFCKPHEASTSPNELERDVPEFLTSLSMANTSRERWLSGWRVEQVLGGGQILATSPTGARRLWPGEFVGESGPGVPAHVGMGVRIFVPRESRTLQTGVYFGFGETLEEPSLGDLVRLYWNVQPTGAERFLALATKALNRIGIPYRVKCMASPTMYVRCDPVVLFVRQRHFAIAACLLNPVYRQLATEGHVRPATPACTLLLEPGLGLAEDPLTGESFGTHRCRL